MEYISQFENLSAINYKFSSPEIDKYIEQGIKVVGA
jgi:hypothetical protein